MSSLSNSAPSVDTAADVTTMITGAPVTMLLPVMDLTRARNFYEQKLGLQPLGLKADGKFEYACGGSTGATLALFPKPEGTKADHTALSFRVNDLTAAIHELENKGVVFEDYDYPELKTVNHVCIMGSEKAAWLKDPEGNYLCLHEDLA